MNEKYSLIVIGAGITGLSTAITWALNNDTTDKPVLVLEKNPIPGGFVTSFKRKGYLFDTIQMIPDAGDILDYLGVNIRLKKFIGYYARIFLADAKTGIAKIINIPSGYNEFRNMLIQRYPDESGSIAAFLDYSRSMYNELYRLKVEPDFLELLATLFRCPKTVLSSGKTFREYYEKFKIRNPEVKEIFDVFAAFSALPAERASAMLTVGAMNTTLDGAYRPEKGFIQLPLKMKERLLELGGRIRLNAEVSRILTDDGRVTGVQLAGGEVLEADSVVTTADPKVAMKKLVGLDVLKSLDKQYAEKVESVKMSVSSFSVNLGLDEELNLKDLGFDCGYNILTTGSGTFARLFEEYDKGRMLMSEDCFHAGIICPSLKTGLKPNLTIRITPCPISDWFEIRETDPEEYTKRKKQVADFYIGLVEKYMIPNLSSHIKVIDASSPATFARYSGSPTGSIYDMAPYPDNFGRSRLAMRTPVKGLYQPKFSHGVWSSLQSGLQVIDMIMKGKIMNGYSRFSKNIPTHS